MQRPNSTFIRDLSINLDLIKVDSTIGGWMFYLG